MAIVTLRFEHLNPDDQNPFGQLVCYLDKEISEQDGYWFFREEEKERVISEFQEKNNSETPLVFSYDDAMEKNPQAVIDSVGETGRDLVRWFAGTFDINTRRNPCPALNIVSSRQVNIRLYEGISEYHAFFALGSAIGRALSMGTVVVGWHP